MNEETKPARDLLLTSGKMMSILLQIIIGIAGTVVAIMIPVVLFNSAKVAEKLSEAGSDANLWATMAAIAVILLLILAVIATAFRFFQLLRRIIDTVAEGEPFTALNAQRLERMGWIALLFQLASIPIGAIGAYLAAHFPTDDFTLDFEFSLTGLLLSIILFILARVFRQGAAMRDDLEGTV